MENDDQHFPKNPKKKTGTLLLVRRVGFVLKNARLDEKVMFASQKITLIRRLGRSWHVMLRERLRHVFPLHSKTGRIGSYGDEVM